MVSTKGYRKLLNFSLLLGVAGVLYLGWSQIEPHRAPSSVVSTQKVDRAAGDLLEEWSPLEVKWSCFLQRSKKRIVSRNAQIFLNGEHCAKRPTKISIINMTNGFEATTFVLSKRFLSDLIRLKPGDNQLRFVYHWPGNKKAETDLVVEWTDL